MSDSDKSGGCISLIAVALCLLIGGGIEWYKAGMQQEAYRRQGIQISRWECFWGIKPAEMAVDLKQKKGSE